MSLKDKTALVIGGGTGIGLGVAQALASEGCSVAIAGRRQQVLQEAAELSRPALLHHPVDVADRQSVADLFRWADDQWGRIDILVNSAGINIKNRSMAEMEPEQWDQVMAVNSTGAYNCMRAVLPQMRRRRDGVIINISSIAGKRAGVLGGVAYDASKFAMSALTTAVANEERGNGIRVTNVFPGEVETPLLENRPNPVTAEHRANILQPDEIAPLIVAIAKLPPRAHVPEVIIKPVLQEYY